MSSEDQSSDRHYPRVDHIRLHLRLRTGRDLHPYLVAPTHLSKESQDVVRIGMGLVAGLFVAALSVAAAVFLILELDGPLDGVIKISRAPLRYALAQLGPTP